MSSHLPDLAINRGVLEAATLSVLETSASRTRRCRTVTLRTEHGAILAGPCETFLLGEWSRGERAVVLILMLNGGNSRPRRVVGSGAYNGPLIRFWAISSARGFCLSHVTRSTGDARASVDHVLRWAPRRIVLRIIMAPLAVLSLLAPNVTDALRRDNAPLDVAR